MMALHHFYLQAEWPGGRNSVGLIRAGNLQSQISIPTEMDGPGIGTNPDEMLLGAAATCYLITLAASLERSAIEIASLSLSSEAIVDVTNGVFTFRKMIHRPHVMLKKEHEPKQMEKIKRLVELAEKNCMISKAINGNVEVELEPNIMIKK